MSESATIFLPPTGDRPTEPAPYVLTDEEVARMLRLDSDPYDALRRYRDKGWLKATQVGKHVRYLLPDVIKFLDKARAENPR